MDDVAYDNPQAVLRLGDSLRHRSGRPGIAPIAVSVGVHAAAIAAFFIAGITAKRETTHYERVAIHLVSPPPTALGPPTPVETTTPVITTPKVDPKKVEPAEKPKAATQAATDKKVVASPKDAKPATGAKPKPGPVGGEDLNIVQEGVPFPFPQYLENVVKRLGSFLRWTGAKNLTATVEFFVKRDGTVGGVNLLQSSGNDMFDLAAVAAVENAGKAKVFGALPKDYQSSRLPISFTFVPNN